MMLFLKRATLIYATLTGEWSLLQERTFFTVNTQSEALFEGRSDLEPVVY